MAPSPTKPDRPAPVSGSTVGCSGEAATGVGAGAGTPPPLPGAGTGVAAGRTTFTKASLQPFCGLSLTIELPSKQAVFLIAPAEVAVTFTWTVSVSASP